jgi:hypothetical protein
MYVIADGIPIKILSFNMTLLLLRIKSTGKGHLPIIPCYLISSPVAREGYRALLPLITLTRTTTIASTSRM